MINILYVLVGVIILWFIIDFVLLSWDVRKNKIFQVCFKYKPKSVKFNLPKIESKEKESFWFFMVAFFLCLGLIIAEFIMFLPETGIINYIGAVIVLIAGLIRIWSRSVLHKFFTLQVLIQEKHELIRIGPYHFIRHPGYLSLLLFLLGLGIAFSSKFGLALLIILFVPSLVYRIVKEEELMLAKFGKDYIYYINSTKRLIPFVY
ncbi:isoprenylcysteine carboxylmethyltransferase family protein [Candidatus Woesearchaeota archaeon]|nr:isoprenylcysteine carboxylmethyltransferase family protein [Candidatus Woesearchaeota archaeon]